MKTLLGVSGPSARHLHSAPALCWEYRLWGQGCKEVWDLTDSLYFPWEVEGCELFMSQMPKSLFFQLCSWVPLPLRGGGPLCLFSFSPGPPVHTQPAFPGGGGKGVGKEWMGCWDSDSEMLLLVCWFCWVTPSQSNKWDFPDCSLGLRAGTES